MAWGQNMKAILETIARLENDRARIDGQIDGLRQALKLQFGTVAPYEIDAIKRTRRGKLKETVLDLITESAEKGLTTYECVSKAKAERGIALVNSSVSSLLSRLKSDDILFFDGRRYSLKQYAGPKHAA